MPGAVWRQGGQRPASAGTRTPKLPLPVGQKTEELGPCSALQLDQTTHTHTHTHQTRVHTAGSTHPDQPPERRLERDEAFKPQPAHSGHHSPRRRCYKTWCGVCGSGGHACGSGTAPSPVIAGDDGNVKIHSSPLQRMGSGLHTGMCRCHGAPGISSGRASGHGCQESLVRISSPHAGSCCQAKLVVGCLQRAHKGRLLEQRHLDYGRWGGGAHVCELQSPDLGLLKASFQGSKRQSMGGGGQVVWQRASEGSPNHRALGGLLRLSLA